ncbi:serine protease inhibitor 42Dd-like [Cloeon dipterum]|uniref:serine protease inhibitor 42Dd-like n=1 Tax=Cloeon dipterum TaxID=197152 RepID=UPI00321F92CA
MGGLKVVICALLLTSCATANDFEKIVLGHQNFGRELFKQFSTSQGNVVVSPLSAYLALALTRLGAKGATEGELSQGLGLESSNQHDAGFSSLFKSLETKKDLSKVVVANKIFLNEQFSLSPTYNEGAKRIFHTTADKLNFKNTESIDIINNWVRNVTRHRIHGITDNLNGDAEVLILNMLYFRGPWRYQFYGPSQPRPFYVDQGNAVDAQFMSKEDYYKYADLKDLNTELIELPYKDPDYSFVILLPKEKNGLRQLENSMQSINIEELLKKAVDEEITLNLPKFQFQLATSLNKPLQNMNIKSIFSDNADLSGLTGTAGQRLRVSEVFQKTHFGINENGTEAAASTSIQIVAISAKLNEHIITCDRPFLFYLMHKRSITLFQGRVVDPRS